LKTDNLKNNKVVGTRHYHCCEAMSFISRKDAEIKNTTKLGLKTLTL